jgi:hypothetical protein
MTRDERRRQAAKAIDICERIGPRLKAQGDVADLSDAQLERLFTGVELRAAQWLRYVAQMCAKPKRASSSDTGDTLLTESD